MSDDLSVRLSVKANEIRSLVSRQALAVVH